MVVSWIHTFAEVILVLVVLQLIKAKVLERDRNSGLGKALAFVC